MTDGDYQLEQALRAQTRQKNPQAAARVLADFYEQRGQPSRATLWRKGVLVRARAKFPAEQVIQDERWQRKVAMWLAGYDASHAVVGEAFRSTKDWVRVMIRQVEGRIYAAANTERFHPTMTATRRLLAVGALPFYEIGGLKLGELPPESWPVTRTKEQLHA